jgi:hypothetical protein
MFLQTAVHTMLDRGAQFRASRVKRITVVGGFNFHGLATTMLLAKIWV